MGSGGREPESPWGAFFREFQKHEFVIQLRRKDATPRSGGMGHVKVENDTDKFLDRLRVTRIKPSGELAESVDVPAGIPPRSSGDVPFDLGFLLPIAGIFVQAVLEGVANLPDCTKPIPEDPAPLGEIVVLVDQIGREPTVHYLLNIETTPGTA